MSAIEDHVVEVEGIRLHAREAGPIAAPPVLLLHGWPTSSFLYRAIIPHLAGHRRVIALDLPGFGASDKPLDASYSFRFYRRMIDGYLAGRGIDRCGLVVHDLGGPVGLYWLVQQPERVEALALLNTLVYPQFSWAVAGFMLAVKTPGLRRAFTGPWGLRKAMQIGMATPPGAEVIAGVQAPFPDAASRKALLQSVTRLHLDGFKQIAACLPAFAGPVRIIYGTADRILPDVARTMDRVQQDLPQADRFALEGCGHFLQEDRPDEVGRLLGDFFRAPG